MGQDGDVGVEVTRGAAPAADIPLAADSYPGAVVDTGRDFDQYLTLALFIAGAVALGAGLGDDSALASTPATGGPGPNGSSPAT